MSVSVVENSLFTPIFDQIQSFVDYVSVSINYIEGNDVTLMAYRGPLLQSQALAINFDLTDAAILRTICNKGKPLLLSDTFGDTPIAREHRKNVDLLRVNPFTYNKSWIGVPLRINEHDLFILEVSHDEQNYYQEKHLSALQRYIDDETIRIRNAAFATILTRRANEYDAIRKIQHAIFSRLEYSGLIDLVVEQVQQMTSTLHVIICSAIENSYSVIDTSKSSQEVFDSQEIVREYSNLINQIILSGKTLRIVDTQIDPRVDAQISQRLGIRSLLIAPLKATDRPIGAILAINKEMGSFGPFDERIISTLANEASIGLENAHLFREEQQRRRIAEEMQAILTQLSSNKPFHKTLDIILHHTAQLFSNDAATLFLLNHERNRMVLEATYQMDESLVHELKPPLATSAAHSKAGNGPYPAGFFNHLPVQSGTFADSFLSARRILIFTNDTVSGVLDMYWKAAETRSPEHIHMAASISQYISLAIERNNLLKKTAYLARLQEQQRIAQALHDTVAQMLFRLGMEAHWCVKNLSLDETGEKRIKTMLRLVERSNEELRSAIFALNDHDPDGKHSLIDMIRDLLHEFQNETGIITSLCTTPDIEPLATPLADAVFRIVREALNNTRKHACASTVLVSLNSDACHLRLTIQDNGLGFQKDTTEKTDLSELHFGLTTMHRLVSQLGGKIIFGNNDEHGVIIKADFPIC